MLAVSRCDLAVVKAILIDQTDAAGLLLLLTYLCRFKVTVQRLSVKPADSFCQIALVKCM